MGNEHLVRAFDKAGLKLDVQDAARFARSTIAASTSVPVFAMGINHRNWGDQFWMAPSDARVEVLNHDRGEGQVVVFVKEEPRFFTERLNKKNVNVDRRLADIVGESEDFIWVRRRADGDKRHFLMGHDERPKHYFIAQLPRAAETVARAHEVLKNPVVPHVEGKVVRQGEWFFLPATEVERAAANAAVDGALSYGRKVPIGPAVLTGAIVKRQWGGNPHTADEIVIVRSFTVNGTVSDPRVSGSIRTESRVAVNAVFVRGHVRHVEHDTVNFRSWVKVVKNTERVADARSGVAVMRGVAWVD